MKAIAAAVLMIALVGCKQAQPPKPEIAWGAGIVTASCPKNWMIDYGKKANGKTGEWMYCRAATRKERAKYPNGNLSIIGYGGSK